MKEKEQKCLNKKETNGGMAFSNPVSGLNDNLEIMGKQLHIQTENTGFPAARIVTQVFCKGRVILSRKTDHASTGGDTSHIRELMNSQHLQIIREIKGKLSQLRIRTTRNAP